MSRVTLIWAQAGAWILLLFWGTGFAQPGRDMLRQKNPIPSLVSNVAGDVWHVISAPARMSITDALWLGSFLALNSGLIYAVDDPADDAFGRKGYQAVFLPAKGLVEIGEVYDQIGTDHMILGLSVGLLAGGVVFRDQKLLQTARLMIESLVMASTITYYGKRLVGRARPFTESGSTTFQPLDFGNSHRDYRAMPSGHATSAFAMMTVIARQYRQWWIRYPAYMVGVTVALQRMDDRQHWMSDVLVGGGIGYWVGSTLVNQYRKPVAKTGLVPYLFLNQFGVALQL